MPDKVTFLIPLAYDHVHRRQNAHLVIRYLKKHFAADIIVMEQYKDTPMFSHLRRQVTYMGFQSPWFHRTKMLNTMAKATGSKFIVNWDADVLIRPQQHTTSMALLQDNPVVYPYGGEFIRLDRKRWIRPLSVGLDLCLLDGTGQHTERTDSVGGAVYFQRDAFFEGGGENENFISYGPEDLERHHRFATLGYGVARAEGPIYHMDHYVGINSYKKHQHYQANVAQWELIRAMDKDQLRKHVGELGW